MDRSKRVMGKPRRTIGASAANGTVDPSLEPQTPENTVFKGGELLQQGSSIVETKDTGFEPPLASAFNLNMPDIILSDADVLDGITPRSAFDPLLKSPSDKPQESEDDSIGIDIDTQASFACPICNELMVSLLQLNRHIDDMHSTPSPPSPHKKTAPTPNDELRSWLRKTTEVGSRLQTALPKKFGLDIFDNSSTGLSESSRDSSSTSLSTQQQPEALVTRRHWKKPQPNDQCSFDNCSRRLNVKNGIVNCRRCGKLFCKQHTLFRIKLDQNARYDTAGTWCRCCQRCFVTKPGYNDFGTVNELTSAFKEKRQLKINEMQLYENKLHKRIDNLVKAFNSIDYELRSEQFFLKIKANQKKREAEQRLVHWESEQAALSCFICFETFTFTLRKHHCRLCGRVVCGSDKTQCSREIPFAVFARFITDSRSNSNDQYPIRICHECEDVFTAKQAFTADLKKPLSPLLSKFEHQQRIKAAILFLLPKFQQLIQTLQRSETLENSVIKEASRQRKRLVDSFAQFDKLTKEMINLPADLEDEKRLQHSIKGESFSFIQKNMAPLKQLPRIIQQIEKKEKESQPVRLNHSQVQKIKQMREELMVLNEQKFLVEEMISSSKKQRKFDEIGTLEQNLVDLTKMIDELQINLGNEGF
jgi:hypothetical protein